MTIKPTPPQASQDVIEALERAISHYKNNSEDSERKAKTWHKEAAFYAKELTTYRMLAAIFASLFVVSFVINISK